MVGATCCFRDCYGSNSSKHRFPNPTTDPERFKKWLIICNNAELSTKSRSLIYTNHRVCGKHFLPSDFASNNRLLRTAVPNADLPYCKWLQFLNKENSKSTITNDHHSKLLNPNRIEPKAETFTNDSTLTIPSLTTGFPFDNMPGRSCAVFGCKNNSIATKARGEDIIYHRFPKDTNLMSSSVGKEWIKRCKRSDKFNPLTSQICSIHFTHNDYERDLQNELLGLPLKRILKKTAVPTLHLPESQGDDKNSSGQNLCLVREKTFFQDSLNESSSSEPSSPSSIFIKEEEVILSENDAEPEIINEYCELQKKYEELKNEFNKYKQRHKKQIRLLRGQLRYYKSKYHNNCQEKKLQLR